MPPRDSGKHWRGIHVLNVTFSILHFVFQKLKSRHERVNNRVFMLQGMVREKIYVTARVGGFADNIAVHLSVTACITFTFKHAMEKSLSNSTVISIDTAEQHSEKRKTSLELLG